MKKYTFTTGILLLSLSSFSQAPFAEASISQLQQYAADGTKLEVIEAYNELAYRYRASEDSIDYARDCAQRAYQLSEAVQYRKGRADAANRLGLIFTTLGPRDSVELYYLEALRLRRDSLDDLLGAAGVLDNLGNYLRTNTTDQAAAIRAYADGLVLLQRSGFSKSGKAGRIHNNLGILHMDAGNYDRAVRHLDTSFQVFSRLADVEWIGKVRLNQGVLALEMQNYEQAERYFKQSLHQFSMLEPVDQALIAKTLLNIGSNYGEREEYETAISYQNQALSYKEALEPVNQFNIYSNLGLYYDELEDAQAAALFYGKALAMAPEISDRYSLAEFHLNYGVHFLRRGSYPVAIEELSKGMHLAQTIQARSLEEIIYADLAYAFAEQKEPDSVKKYVQNFLAIADTMSRRRIDAYIGTQRSQEQKIQVASLKMARYRDRIFWTTIASIGGILLLITFSINFYQFAHNQRQKYRNQQQEFLLAERERELELQEMEERLTRSELDQAYARISGIDQERKRISEDLHDRLGGTLSLIKLQLESINERLQIAEKELMNKQEKAIGLLNDAVEEVRNISHNIYPKTLSLFGLKKHLEDVLVQLPSENLQVEFVTHGLEDRLETSTEIEVYQIIRELITNVIRHASANHLSIFINRGPDKLNITVEDDGIGFDPTDSTFKFGMGLLNVESRVHKLDGELNVDSTPGKGTTVFVDIPLQKSD